MPRYLTLPTADLHTFHRNPRRGDIKTIAESLRRHGQYRAIVVNEGTHTGRPLEVLAGNHTLMAARELGWETIDVALIDVTEEDAKAIVLADNRLADLGEYDTADLHALLSSLDQLDGTGYTDLDLAALERDLFPPVPRTDPDDAPPVPDEPISRPGQLWHLGNHRLLIGDSTDSHLVGGVLFANNEPADCVWTDPPYGVDYVGKTKDALTIRNDGAEGLSTVLNGAFTTLITVCKPGTPAYIAAPAGPLFVEFAAAMHDAGLNWRQTLTWVKNTMVLGRSDYHYRHEPIFYAFTPGGAGRLGRGGDRWYGDNTATTVLQYDKPARNPDHPTMKPVALIDAMLTNSCPPGGIVYDPFAGSGSTLIAAHARGARAYCVELDPRYADVILRRYEAHTGNQPTLDGTPVTFTRDPVDA